MSDAVRFPLVLGVISLCSAAGLAVSYSVTRDEIRLQEKLRKARGLRRSRASMRRPRRTVRGRWRSSAPRGTWTWPTRP